MVRLLNGNHYNISNILYIMDPISITALVISLLAALGHFLKEVHLRKLKCACIESDCMDEQKRRSKSSLTPPDTPIPRETSV